MSFVKNKWSKVLAMVLAVVMVVMAMPMSAFAAVASDLPEEMVDHSILRALAYTGYDVDQQIADGTLYQSGSYGSRTPSNILSGINYGTSTSGFETVADASTVTGLAPNIARYQDYGLCCASFVTYYICNYLPNIEGVDTQFITDAIKATGWNSQAVVTWQKALNGLADEGKIEKIGTSASNVDRSKLAPGDIVIFGDSENSHKHVAIYSGTYKGVDFIIHVGNDRGPEISRIDWMGQAGDKSSYPNAYFHLPDDIFENDGSIEVYKEDTDGNALAGAYFTATNTETNEKFVIGPTDGNGYAKSEDRIPYGTYTITETVFPTNYRAYGTTTWTKTLDSETPNATITIEAVNELIPGSAKIVKNSEDGEVAGVRFTIKGNGVDKTVTTDANGEIKIDNLKPGSYTVTEIVADEYEPQEVRTVTIVSGQTATVTFNNVLKRGSLQVTKDSEDGLVEGVQFKLSGTSLSGLPVEQYAVTNANGVATFEDVLISGHAPYVLEEVNTAERYIVPENQTAAIEWNEVTNNYFYNELKRGDLKVTKTAEDGLVEGMKFHLYGTSLSGAKVDEYAYTDENGIAMFYGVLIGEGYTLEEVNTNIRYVVPAKQTADIAWNEVTNKTFENILKKFRVDVFKVDGYLFWGDPEDEESGGLVPVSAVPMSLAVDSDQMVNEYGWPYGVTQGDATLEGAVYGLYNNGVLVDTYTTDKNGYFLTDYYVCGDNWYLQEITPSEGYLLDDTRYYIDCSAYEYTVELNTEYVDVYEAIVRGKIAIIKHCDDGSTKIETPEEGAVFAVYLKSAGSYDNAEEKERAILFCDEFGFAETAWLPYGTYVVEQVDGWEGKEMMPAFDVNINADGETYRYLINNATFEAEIEIVKKDIETGNIIPAAGIGFKVRNTDTGEYVIQRVNYPTPVDIEVYYTDSTGKLMLPAPLPYGNYEIIEQNTCYGYVLDSDPVAFKVDGSTDIVTVVKSNIAQKGTITIEKTGEVFSSVRENEGIYQPVYEVKGLAGAVYEITAAEDIVTLDGTIRYTKGQVVATVTTDADGRATTEPLYLGKFTVKEVTAPHGMVLNTKPVDVELTYAGENVKVTTTSTSFYNERQKVTIDLSKSLEKDDVFNIGNGDEITRVQFALYAAEDLTAEDGRTIPKDALIEIEACDTDGKISFKTDLPVGAKVYVKEYATDSHYILSDLIYEVTFDYEGQDTDTVRKKINDGNAIENEMIRGSIVGKKLDEDGFAICGALFGLFAESETEFTEETAILTCESNEIGVFHFENVPFGRWIVREIKAAPAFVLNESSYAVTVSEHEQVVEVTIENEFITGTVKTTKVDKEYPENTLSGAIFEIFVDVDGNQEFDAEIDLLVGEMTETENGIYTMDNLRYNGYFLYEKVAPEGFLKDDGYYYFEIRNDGETVVVENEAGIGFTNQPIKGNVTTTKVDEEYPENKLTGAKFHIYADTDKNGEFNAEIDTFVVALSETELGVYLAEGVRFGGYFLYEETAPVGFVKDDTYHYFEIRNDGETIVVENKAGAGFTNKPIVGELELTKTDIADGKPLAGVGFRIKDVDGNTVIEGYTDENGIAKFTLRYGKYTYSEFDPLDGYVANTDEYPFEITEDGQIVKASVTNEKIPVPDIPQTGDNSNLGFWIGLGAIALGGLIATAVIAIKRKKDDED